MISNGVWIGPKGKHFPPPPESCIPQFLLDEKKELMVQMIRRGEHEAQPTKGDGAEERFERRRMRQLSRMIMLP